LLAVIIYCGDSYIIYQYNFNFHLAKPIRGTTIRGGERGRGGERKLPPF
jgi:hypothetical protein